MTDTRERILAQGLDLLTEAGFANLTIGVLAERAGMSKSGLFAHFGSKEEIQLKLLEETLRVGAATFIEPAMHNPPGLSRLRAVVNGWFGWTAKAGLHGGCPIAAGMFEFDDTPSTDPIRQRLLSMEERWRAFLVSSTAEAVDAGELRAGLDLEQFVWDLCGIYLNHHVSLRFLHDPIATERAQAAFESLIDRSLRTQTTKGQKKLGTRKPN